MKHRHADVLVAIAEGKEVQWQSLSDGSWNDMPAIAYANPIIDPHLNWRIKPEPKPDFIQTRQVSYHDIDGLVVWVGYTQNVEFTFDGETLNLKSVRMLP